VVHEHTAGGVEVNATLVGEFADGVRRASVVCCDNDVAAGVNKSENACHVDDASEV
jgi:hypothetical protein